MVGGRFGFSVGYGVVQLRLGKLWISYVPKTCINGPRGLVAWFGCKRLWPVHDGNEEN